MFWFPIALLGPLLWSASNHIDKHLLEGHFKERSAGSLFLFGGIMGIATCVAVLVIDPAVLQVPFRQAGILLLGSIAGSGMLYCYLRAMRLGEASVVAALFQLIPVLYLFLGYWVFGETLGHTQLLGSGLIIAGAIFLSLEMAKGAIRINSKFIGWMVLANFLTVLNGLAFKYVGLANGYLPAVFWDACGVGVSAIALICFAPVVRRDFTEVLSRSGFKLISLLLTNEGLTLIGNLCFTYAQLLAPLALVSVCK